MSTGNLFNKEFRESFIRSADIIKLNEYIKNLEKLSQKGGKYLDVYNSVVDFVINNNIDAFQEEGNLLNLHNTKEEYSCDTETYLKKIDRITKNDDNYNIILSELDGISKVLSYSMSDWKTSIQKFIDLIINFGEYSNNKCIDNLISKYSEICKLITENQQYLKESFNYIDEKIKSDRSKISDAFIEEYLNLKKKRGKMTTREYKNEKNQIMKRYMGTSNSKICLILTSKFIIKVAHHYKKT